LAPNKRSALPQGQRHKNCRDERRRRPVDEEKVFAALPSPAAKNLKVSHQFDQDCGAAFN